MEKQFSFDYEHYAALSELPEADRLLVAEAEQATEKAHAAYSKFRVGAAARLRSGRILHGGNVESEVYPAGLCAERTLLFYASANYADDPIEALAIASQPSERECYPCGQCRQVFNAGWTVGLRLALGETIRIGATYRHGLLNLSNVMGRSVTRNSFFINIAFAFGDDY